MKNVIKKELNKRGIIYRDENSLISTYCPFCQNEMICLRINANTGDVSCFSCKKEKGWEEFIAKLDENKKQEEILNKKSVESEENKNQEREIDNKMVEEFKKETGNKGKYMFEVLTAGEIISREYESEKWLIKDILPMEAMMVISAPSGGFKTFLSQSIAISISRGLPVFGHYETIQTPVLFIDEENSGGVIKKRLLSFGIDKNENKIHYISQKNFKVDKGDGVEGVLEIVRDKKIKLIIIDSYIRIHSVRENDSSEMAKVSEKLRLFSKAGIAVILIHHHKKSNGHNWDNMGDDIMRGSSDIAASVDTHLIIKSNKNNNFLTLKAGKFRYSAPISDAKIEIIKSGEEIIEFRYAGESKEKAEEKYDEAIEEIRNLFNDEEKKSREEIHKTLREAFGFGRDVIDSAVKEAVNRKIIERVKKEGQKGNKAFYRLIGD